MTDNIIHNGFINILNKKKNQKLDLDDKKTEKGQKA